MEAARIEAQLEPMVLPDTSCSVFWLIPDGDREELTTAMETVTARMHMLPWGFLGAWDQSTKLASQSEDISQAARLSAHYSVGDTHMTANVIEIPLLKVNWFWSTFAAGPRQHQICATLMPPGTDIAAGWAYAGLQLVLAEAARQVRPGRTTHGYALRALAQAFLAETLLAGGIAVSRLQSELLPPGIALTATSDLIDQVAADFRGAAQVDPLLLERSRWLSGN
jgi:hypothetical protein